MHSTMYDVMFDVIYIAQLFSLMMWILQEREGESMHSTMCDVMFEVIYIA